MSSPIDPSARRRRFLQFLAGSPLYACGGLSAFAADGPTAPAKLPDPIIWAPLRTEDLIKSPKDAINVFDFEPVARVNIPPAHFGYMASGIDDEVTLRANREGFLKFHLRPRRLVDVSKVDMSTEILGVRYDSPIIVAPVGARRPSTRRARSPSRGPPKRATTSRSSRPPRTARSRKSSLRVARPSGTSSMRPTNGKWRRRW